MTSSKTRAFRKFALSSSFAVVGVFSCVWMVPSAEAQSSLPELRGIYDDQAYRLRPISGSDNVEDDQQPIVRNTNRRSRNQTENDVRPSETVQFRSSSRLPRLRTLRDRQSERQADRRAIQSSRPTLGVGATGGRQVSGTQTTSGSEISPQAPIPLSDISTQRARPEQAVPQVQDPVVLTGSEDDATPSILNNTPAPRSQSGNSAVVDDDPFAPVGTRWGVFDIAARIQQFFGYSSNFRKSAGGKSASFSETNANLGIRSNWSRHELQLNVDGTYLTALDGDESDQPTLNLNSQLRLDLVDGWSITPEIFYTHSTENFSSRELTSDVSQSPELNTYGGAFEVGRTGRKLGLNLRGVVTQSTFSDAKLNDGTKFDQSDRDNTRYEAIARVSYETSPAVRPFVEGRYSARDFDKGRDRNGTNRDSQTYEVRTGVELDLGEKLQGELALGYLVTEFDDSDLKRLETFTLNGNLVWSPVRETTVTFNLATTTSPSTQVDTNGSVSYALGVDYQQQMTDRLSFNLNAGVNLTTEDGSSDQDATYSAGIGTEYFLSRNWAVSADVDYERFQAEESNRDYEDVTGRVGLIWQK